MRHEPDRVGGIAREAAAQVVVDAAPGHGVQGAPRHRQRSFISPRRSQPQQELDRHRLGELGRAAPAAGARVEAVLDRRECVIERHWIKGSVAGRTRVTRDGVRQIAARALNLVAPLAPRLADAGEHLAE